MSAYYNEHDHEACAWLARLMKRGRIPKGDIDERCIRKVRVEEIRGYEQVHFFAGIGGWAHALRLARWEGRVTTGSCPCQPFSSAGKGEGERDSRHLWPEMRRLLAGRRDAVVFGEQVASADGRAWYAGVRDDLEALGFAPGAADLCAAGVKAPHNRPRIYWMGKPNSGERGESVPKRSPIRGEGKVGVPGNRSRVDDSLRERREEGRVHDGEHERLQPGPTGGRVAHSNDAGFSEHGEESRRRKNPGPQYPPVSRRPSFWDRREWLDCGDGRTRAVEPGTFPLANGVPGRVALLKGYGNAIVPDLAAQFIAAAREAMMDFEESV